MADYISREAAAEQLRSYKIERDLMVSHNDTIDFAISVISAEVPAADVRPVPPGGIGEMSDGYHTFNGLYYQRMVLFAALVKQNKDSAWKSHRHEDGELCFGGGWFIVGIDTPEGSYTYHYEDKDWDLFDCEELPVGKHWDGHIEDDVTRLLSLPEMRPVVRGEWERPKGSTPRSWIFGCSKCGDRAYFPVPKYFPKGCGYSFCPNCGADMAITDRRYGEERSDHG